MLEYIIIIFILIGLTIHRYLSTFWETGTLPYPSGFSSFAMWFALTYLVSFIWMFGAILGVIITALCFFQIIYSSLLWIFLLPGTVAETKRFRANYWSGEIQMPAVNEFVYGSFSLIVIATAILTVINFFISPYGSMWELMRVNIWSYIVYFALICIVGNIARIISMAVVMKGVSE